MKRYSGCFMYNRIAASTHNSICSELSDKTSYGRGKDMFSAPLRRNRSPCCALRGYKPRHCDFQSTQFFKV